MEVKELRGNLGYIFVTTFMFLGCYNQCYFLNTKYLKYHGSLRIDTIYTDVATHNDVMRSKDGSELRGYFEYFSIKPMIGDSILKEEGSLIYTLIKKDSIIRQRFDCESESAVIVSLEKY